MSILGVWMWPQSIRVYGAEKTVERCAMAGVTDIYFLSKGLAGTVSYRSALAPSCSDRDFLSELLQAAHACGIRVHAWLTSANDEHYKALHPQSGRCHYTRGRDKALVSLTDVGYLGYMEQIVSDLCRNYDIDGLHLDYIRYNHLLYGWSQEDQARYAACGADIAHLKTLMDKTFLSKQNADGNCIFDALRDGDESVRALAQVRRSDVRHFAQTLTAYARAQRNDLILTAALMPEGAYEDTAFADLHYGQSYEDAAALYDYVLPMAYSKAYGKDGSWVRSVAEGTIKKGIRTVMGLHAYERGTCLSLREDINALKQTAVDGICLFRDGAFALALMDGRHVQLHNTLESPITAVCAGPDEAMLTLERAILPGEERTLTLTHVPDTLRVFSGETEGCVYLTDDKSKQKR